MPQPIYREDYEPSTHLIKTTELDFNLGDDETIVELQITFIKNTDPSGLLPNSWRTDRETYFLGCN